MNELTKFCQQLKNLTKRIKKLKQNLINSNDVRMKTDLRRSPSPISMWESVRFLWILICKP